MSQNEVKRTIEKEISLPGIFGVEALELLSIKLSQATDFSFTVIDYRGNPLTDGIICNKFCENHKDKRECAECQITAAFAAAKSAIKCCPYLFSCPLGLYSIAVPIIVNEQYLGALVGGRVRCPGEDESLSFSREEEYQNLPIFAEEKLKAIGDLMFFMLREMGEKETMELKLSSSSEKETAIEDLKMWNAALREELRKAELRQLRAHIHPQFLLNMFETVANYAIIEDAEKTEEVIVDYASIIRYYLEDSVEITTIEREFLQINRYLSVFKSQYGNKFQYHIKVADSVKKIRIPSLILFPFLGYVINYGIFVASKSVLFIDAESKEDQCQVIMQLDNQTLSQEKEDMRAGHIMDESMIDRQLEDTKKRLFYVYGDKYDLELKANMITLRFPVTISNLEVR